MDIHNSILKKDFVIKFGVYVNRTIMYGDEISKQYNKPFQNGDYKAKVLDNFIGILKTILREYTFLWILNMTIAKKKKIVPHLIALDFKLLSNSLLKL